MRRIILTALMINLILLCGCTDGIAKDETRIEEWREQELTDASVSFETKLTAYDDERVLAYTLRCARDGDGTVMELLSPQLISGVTARISGRDAVLEFDGLSLSTDVLDENGMSPLSAPAIILNALESGMITQMRREAYKEHEALAFRVQLAEQSCVDFWLDAETMALLQAELLIDEQMIVSCEITDWYIEED